MIQINQIKLPVTHTEEELLEKVLKALNISKRDLNSYYIKKRSIDGRKKPEIFYVYSIVAEVKNEQQVMKKVKDRNVIFIKETSYQMPSAGNMFLSHRPVIIGAGPAGLFCAFLLAECGVRPIVFERGKRIEDRMKDVETFWKEGVLKPNSNVQFGEGGAGTFSDGKLNTGVKDPYHRNDYVLKTFVRFGAPAQILYDAKPHIGTDILANVILNMRNYLVEKGVDFYFETQITDFKIINNHVSAVFAADKEIPCEAVVLALGHSARDTFKRLFELSIPMEAKSFAVGFRVEHPQEMIDSYMYGDSECNLPAAPYKVTANFPNGRGVYSFCMCPGGYVVNASSYEEGLVVNGMSYSARDGKNANSAIIVSVGPEDFNGNDALAGIGYQEQLERKAYTLANGKIPQQLYGDFCKNVPSTKYGAFDSSTKGTAALTNLRGLLSEDMEESFIAGMEHFNKIIPGFSREDAILSGVESRTSSPIRILRDERFESKIKGIYPCGEGAGYAGGIMSAAMDGIKVAEAIITHDQVQNR